MTFGRPSREEMQQLRAIEKRKHLMALLYPTVRPLHRGVYGPADTAARPKQGIKAKPGKGAPNRAERVWLSAITAYGCIACRIDGLGFRPAAVHHILQGGVRMGHLYTLPLCDPGHHQNGAQFGMVSRHPWKARFEQRYGSELHLLARLRAELEDTQ